MVLGVSDVLLFYFNDGAIGSLPLAVSEAVEVSRFGSEWSCVSLLLLLRHSKMSLRLPAETY